MAATDRHDGPDAHTAQAYDLLGPLPTGTTVLEASAGTGKTFTIAALVARYVAEGAARMDELLVVSFSRASTRELRDRVRERLVVVRDAIAAPHAAGQADDVTRFLVSVDDDELARRRRRIEEALRSFDAATVTTTHGFCQQMLVALGTVGDYDDGVTLIEDVVDITAEVSDDFFLRKWAADGAEAVELDRGEFGELALDVARDPATALVPGQDAPGIAGTRSRIAHRVLAEVSRRKRRDRLVDYDDMLVRLDAALRDPASGPVARQRLRDRYQVVLVDEFQDTDPVQWSIVREAFHGHRTLVLIGDPKQAIYGFRGADVHAYLEAMGAADAVSTLGTNWRSDETLLRGIGAMVEGAGLGDARIAVHPVRARHTDRMLDDGAAVRLRVLQRSGMPLAKRRGTVLAAAANPAVAADVAATVVDLLSGSTLTERHDGAQARPLRPGDVAVLVQTNTQVAEVQAALREVGVPAVASGRTSVLATPAAHEWQLLLEALEEPQRSARVRRLALGCFAGVGTEQLDRDGERVSEDLALRLRTWSSTLERRGVAAMFAEVSMAQDLQGRLLRRPDGERLLTDLRHIAEALHHEATAADLGLSALLVWLRRRRADAVRGDSHERSRRLESDAEAVQVTTVHTSKGLEWPVVLVPYAWTIWSPEPSTVVFHDEQGRRTRDVGGPSSPTWAANKAVHQREERDDDLRLTYVALTRAMTRLVVWWAPGYSTASSPLHRLLLRPPDAPVPPDSVPLPEDDDDTLAAFSAIAARSDGALAVEVVDRTRPERRWQARDGAAPALRRARFARELDLDWTRTSYSALTRAAHEADARFGSEPEVTVKDDEQDTDDEAGAMQQPSERLDDVASVWDELPGGAAFGTVVHSVFELLDDPGDPRAVRDAVDKAAAGFAGDLDVDRLTDAIARATSTPLGPLAVGRALDDIPAADRLSELDFELPLNGGDEPRRQQVLLAELADVWRTHCAGRPLEGYADALAALAPSALRGYLTGSIDAVLRVREASDPAYLVVDYKTNRLAYGEPLTAWHYRRSALEVAMVEAHYPLQALLYQVALHRYLRWRQPGYDPRRHLGGVLYLFLRGMSGPGVLADDGSAPGVFDWRPPAELVVATSDLLAGLR